MRRLSVILLFYLFVFVCQARILRVLAIGNSFSQDAVESYLYDLALSNGDTLIIGNVYRPGQSLESHWSEIMRNEKRIEYRKIANGVKVNTKEKSMKDCIQDEAWDYITFQQSSSYSGISESYEPYLSYLIGYVKSLALNPDVKFGFHMTWAYAKSSNHGAFHKYNSDQNIKYKAIVKSTVAMLNKHNTMIEYVIPSGIAIQKAREGVTGDNLCSDGYHLNKKGRYLAACTWLKCITEISPLGNKFRNNDFKEEEFYLYQCIADRALIDWGEMLKSE